MEVYKKGIKIFGVVIFLPVAFLAFSFIYNKYQVKPTEQETIELKRFYKSAINIKTTEDIIYLQNYTISTISHKPNGIGERNIIKILKEKYGFCYDRSLILQKVMLMNGIEIRPVLLFSNPFNEKTAKLDLFSKNIQTHNIFEFYWKDKWYVMRTNQHMYHLISLDDYLATQNLFKTEPRYIRYLNNRNGRFLSPSWIPDIY
jgi:hypothetical protein